MKRSHDPGVPLDVSHVEVQFRPEEIEQILEARNEIAEGKYVTLEEAKVIVKERTREWQKTKTSRSA
jgi:hypothetical protein